MVKIPEFIALVAEGKFEEAYKKIQETSSLPAVCGRGLSAGKSVRKSSASEVLRASRKL